ncbi:MAG: hypothetical protein EON58_12595 [Alphaproteobacteria bacterium]|nr:MAG: hypothetical protein EON58_12595 [Alphaproteobacteria bacterium]
MPRRQRRSKRRQHVSDVWLLWACDGEMPGHWDDDTPERMEFADIEYFSTPAEHARLWAERGGEAVQEWLKSNPPGTRSDRWWRYAAPEPAGIGETEADYLGRLNLLIEGELPTRLATLG